MKALLFVLMLVPTALFADDAIGFGRYIHGNGVTRAKVSPWLTRNGDLPRSVTIDVLKTKDGMPVLDDNGKVIVTDTIKFVIPLGGVMSSTTFNGHVETLYPDSVLDVTLKTTTLEGKNPKTVSTRVFPTGDFYPRSGYALANVGSATQPNNTYYSSPYNRVYSKKGVVVDNSAGDIEALYETGNQALKDFFSEKNAELLVYNSTKNTDLIAAVKKAFVDALKITNCTKPLLLVVTNPDESSVLSVSLFCDSGKGPKFRHAVVSASTAIGSCLFVPDDGVAKHSRCIDYSIASLCSGKFRPNPGAGSNLQAMQIIRPKDAEGNLVKGKFRFNPFQSCIEQPKYE